MTARIVVIAALLVLVSGLAHAELLKGDQIQTVVSGHKIKGENDLGSPYTIWFSKNGTVKGILGKKNQFDDHGRWWVKDDKLCMHWELWVFAKVTCYEVDLAGDELTRIDRDNTVFILSTLSR